MTVLSIAEKKTQIVVIIGEVTRSNLTSAFGNNLTPVIEQMLQLTPGADLDFAPMMEKALPRIGTAITEIFDQRFMEAVVAPTVDGYSDEEVVNQGLTKYSTPDSLKMKRSDCMKKLVQLAQQWKISNNT